MLFENDSTYKVALYFLVCFFLRNLWIFYSFMLENVYLFRISLSERCNFSKSFNYQISGVFLKFCWFWNEDYFFLNTLIFWRRFTLVASAEIAHSEIGLQNCFLMSQMQFYSFAKMKVIKYLQADRKWRLKNSKASF